ncbi:MAG: hypothetical protein JRH18_13640 [Deltaproteobacteria bacterium]|nr:hypothetical protein [Deltaproteobacteria bacterium]MBW2152698.1 hypothetical protein [Deltaproteobacteria bacterium]
MSNRNLRIGDLIEVPPVQTVIHLEDGRTRSESIARSFVFTDEVRDHFSILAASLTKEHGRGFFLQGDFGSGKSHFLAALTTWLCDLPGAEMLCDHHPQLLRVKNLKRRFLAADVSLINYRGTTPLEKILVEAVETALISHGIETRLTPLSAFLEYFKSLLNTEELAASFAKQLRIAVEEMDGYLKENPRQSYIEAVRFMKQLGLKAPETLVEERYETFQRVIKSVQQAGFDGMVLIIDELSEFFRSKPDARLLNEDARTLQLLGELTATQPLWVIAAVQESIERTGDIAQVTFQKIKDRFPVKLTLSTVHIKALISRRLVKLREGAADELYRIYEYLCRQFPSISWSFEEFQATYPVHPVTISLLNGLGELFSEHRGIVDFVYCRLAGDESRQITGILDHPAYALLGPDSIYDHFCLRMAEFSALHVYPKHVVPHLDEVIEKTIDDPEDQALARRLVRVLVLYGIHPTATLPTVKELTELVSCALSEQDPDLNVQFVAETILDVLVAESKFLVKKRSETADPLQSVYAVVTQQDPAKSFKARLARTASEIPLDDRRLLLEPFFELAESPSWPGPTFLQQGIYRLVNWRQSVRRAFISFIRPGDEAELKNGIKRALSAAECDFAVLFSLGGETDFQLEHTAIWEISLPLQEEEAQILREFLAARQLCTVLRPANPAEAPLIQPARETLQRLGSEASQAALNIFYKGNFSLPEITVEPVIRQIKRFDRLLEEAGNFLLEIRYPGYREIAPRRVTPSRLWYQRLIEEFVSVGNMGLQEARSRGLSDAIEGLASPLGLVELRSGAYVFAPDPEGHPLLKTIFSLLSTAEPTNLSQVMLSLQTGRFGLPRDTVLFLISALAYGGLITPLKNGRTIPLDMLHMTSVEAADSLAPGEVIGRHDRETLTNSCPFLAPTRGWESFGLRQQREVWQNVRKFRDWAQKASADIESRLETVSGFSSFEAFDLNRLRSQINALRLLSDEIKVSYSAREGLERFLSRWRSSGLSATDIDYIKKIRIFLSRNWESFVFVNHYMRHTAVARMAQDNTDIAALKDKVMELLDQPEVLVRDEDPLRLMMVFDRFRVEYARLYDQAHTEHYRQMERKPLSRFADRALVLLERLTAIELLDRPAGLKEFIKQLRAPRALVCKRNLAEELMRSAVCSCGFIPGETPRPVQMEDPERSIETYLFEYLGILRRPEIREAISARAFALADARPNTAKRMRSLSSLLEDECASSTALLDIMDDATSVEISRALSGRVTIERRGLKELFARLGGRRLTPDQVREIVKDWTSVSNENTVIAIEEDTKLPAHSSTASRHWWPMMHADLFKEDLHVGVRELEAALERQFPASSLKERLAYLDDARLARFLTDEPFHTHALRTAWLLLAERILSDVPWPLHIRTESRHVARDIAQKINDRLDTLRKIGELKDAPLPDALRVRLALSKILADPWASTELRSMVRNKIKTIAKKGEEWLTTIPSVSPIELTDNPVVIIADGVSPDVWLETAVDLKSELGEMRLTWHRLEVLPKTASSISALFGFASDAMDEFALREIGYHHIKGNESYGFTDLLPAFPPEKCVVIRLSLIDEAAHTTLLPLSEMAGMLCGFLKRELPGLKEICRQQKRRLVLTTDHGLSLGRRGLTHGKGGVYEQAVFRVELIYCELSS